jgi:drug/metabolite transporter (DMT)-like permease
MDRSVNVFDVCCYSFVLVTIAPRFIPAEEVNLFFLLETIIGPFWVWMVIKEQPSLETIQGGVVIIITIAIHSFSKIKKSLKHLSHKRLDLILTPHK